MALVSCSLSLFCQLSLVASLLGDQGYRCLGLFYKLKGSGRTEVVGLQIMSPFRYRELGVLLYRVSHQLPSTCGALCFTSHHQLPRSVLNVPTLQGVPGFWFGVVSALS